MKYGLIGGKLTHSFSKTIHEQLGNNDYELLEISEENFHDYMIKRDFYAINVTIPYKEKIIPYLDFISPQAKRIGAINTVINKDGKLYGYNTDYDGLKALLKRLKVDCKEKKILILGSGGTSKTARVVIEDLGCRNYYFVSRTKTAQTITYQEAITIHNDCDIIINTTPCGMYPNTDCLPIHLHNFKKLEAVVDVIYNPLRTKFIVKAQNRKILAIGGLYMLVAQAFYASRLFQDKNLNEEQIDCIYHHLVQEKENIVLIGMPSSGKTTIGSMLAKRLHKEFIDTDELIKSRIQMEISEYFSKFGENSFRIVESQVIEEVSKRTNLVIATGGGVILKEVNIENLKENGKIVLLNRSLDNLIATSDRPLTATKEKLETCYFERKLLYKKFCDIVIDNNHDLTNAVDEIIERMKI